MMTDEQKSKVAELKAVIAATGPTREGVPQEVRVAAMVLKRDLRRTGTTARVLAAALGVHESTLCRWEREVGADGGMAAPAKRGRGGRGSFRMVKVATPVTTPRVTPTSSAATHGLRVAHAPSGLVVDGLDVETLAVLLRRMS
jgi:hypothetical protein